MKNMKNFLQFNESATDNIQEREIEVTIDGFKYLIKKANIDVSKFDYEGICGDYVGSYVVIEDDDEDRIRVREFNGSIYDDNNHSHSFDPDNHSDDIHARLSHGDECYIDELYKIVATNNESGSVYYEYLRQNIVHEDLKDIYRQL